MRLQQLRLEDFRGFSELELDLDRSVTVLVGANGSGKTSVVRALELLGSHAAADVFHRKGFEIRFEDADVRQSATRCMLQWQLDGSWLTLTKKLETQSESCNWDALPPALPPLVITLGADRSRLYPLPVRGTRATATVRSRHPAWDDVLQPGRTHFEWSEAWFREREDLENQERVRTARLDYADPSLLAVRTAIEAVLPGYTDPRIDRARPNAASESQLVLTKDSAELPAHLLSDGERSLLVLALTIARRLALLSPAQRAEIGAATVVIDEIELHLHPRWQCIVVPRLVAAFPECQFIVTTHSPQVIASVDTESLIVLDSFAVWPSPAPTKGRDTNAILEEIMGAHVRPPESEERLREIDRLLDSSNLDGARQRVSELAQQWGDDDREVVRLRTALASSCGPKSRARFGTRRLE